MDPNTVLLMLVLVLLMISEYIRERYTATEIKRAEEMAREVLKTAQDIIEQLQKLYSQMYHELRESK